MTTDLTSTRGGTNIALLMMVKDEHRRIEVSLDTIKDLADCVVILDTGSTDNTIELIQNWCKRNNKPLHLKQTTFTNFCNSRNESLDFLDTIPNIDYALLLDCNDEVRNTEGLRKFAEEYKGTSSGFHVNQVWWNGNSLDKYSNIRLIRPNQGIKWRYKRKVHEFMTCKELEEYNIKMFKRKREGLSMDHNPYMERLSDSIFTIYQDRTKDDDKSAKRFKRDKEFLFEDYVEEFKRPEILIDDIPDHVRTLFYLAQTLMCLFQFKESYIFYRKRLHYEGFTEEVFHSFYRCGELSLVLNHTPEERILWYVKSLFYSLETFHNPRIEPMIRLAEYYINNDNLMMAYSYLKVGLTLPYPDELVLFVNKRMYDHTKYFLMAKIGYKINKVKEGFDSLMQCIRFQRLNKFDIDKELELLKYYTTEEFNEEWLAPSVMKDNGVPLIDGVVPKFIEPVKTTYSLESPEMKRYLVKGDVCKSSDNKLMFYIKAMECSCKDMGVFSVDAYLRVAKMMYDSQRWKASMLYAKLAAETEQHSSVSLRVYHIDRWQAVARVSHRFNMTIGRTSLVNAIIHNPEESPEDIELLDIYVKNDELKIQLLEACKKKDVETINKLLGSDELMDTKEIKMKKLKEKVKEKMKNMR